jgi:hypothetical protein
MEKKKVPSKLKRIKGSLAKLNDPNVVQEIRRNIEKDMEVSRQLRGDIEIDWSEIDHKRINIQAI